MRRAVGGVGSLTRRAHWRHCSTEGVLSETDAWIDFYVTAGGASAVVLGLLFVALSINRHEIAAEPHRAGEARQASFALVSVLILSLIMLIPEQSSAALGAELLAGALVNLGIVIPRQVRRVKSSAPEHRRGHALRIAVYNGALLCVIATGSSLIAGAASALYVLVPAVIGFTLLALVNSWNLALLGTRPLSPR
jgi:hypothetical protein